MKVLAPAMMLVLFAGCDPIWSLKVRVVSPSGSPVPDTAVAILCPDDSDRAVSTHADLTDADGEAELGGGAHLPAGCRVSIAKPGYVSAALTLEGLCGAISLDDCDRSQRTEVTLAPLP